MSFYTSLTGLNAATTELSVTSNNIANSATAGFKRSSASFGDIFATSPLQRASAVVGQGVALKEISQEFSQGFVQFSSNSLDLAITGDGFFPLQSSDGSRVYTRNGSFMLNEQNQMVNSAGQALQSLPVDSTNKADFSQPPSALSIPRQTVSEFRATTEVELGLNLPSNVEPITANFNPNKPETYHRTTSLTVYGASGSQHLATIYYVKTQNATADTPENKWQTHVYLDGQRVDSELIQATDSGGDQFFVNKYGELKTASELEFLQKNSTNSSEYLVTQGTVYRKYSFDKLDEAIQSTPATVSVSSANETTRQQLSLAGGESGFNLSAASRSDLRDMLSLSVDGSAYVSLGLEHLADSSNMGAVSGQTIATELTRIANERFGDGRKFDMSDYVDADGTSSGTILQLTRNYGLDDETTIELDVGQLLLDQQTDGNVVFDVTDPQVSYEELVFALNAGLVAANVTDIEISYNLARQGLTITQTGEETLHVTSSAQESALGIPVMDLELDATTGLVADTKLDEVTAVPPADRDLAIKLLGNVVPQGDLILPARDQRYGIQITYFDGKFNISSGTTGDASSIAVRNILTSSDGATKSANELGLQLFGLEYDGALSDAENTIKVDPETSAIANRPAVRGTASTPAIVVGNQMGVDPNAPFSVTADNRNLTVIVDNISAQIELDLGDYQIGDFTEMVQEKINLMADNVGRQVSGVQVDFDLGVLRFTGATATDDSFLQVAGSADFGLEDVDSSFGQTSTYIELEPDTQGASTPLYVFQDRNGTWIETTDKQDFDENDIPQWRPIFLDKGELTFNTSGTLVSPVNRVTLASSEITGNQINLDYAASTQFNSPFAVLSQSQNGAPEGDLVGVNIGEDGLVVASYSNGSQKSLGKIILANFATPKGLRQVGNSGFVASSESGEARQGEPGSAGFGTIRAGATERSNVDLTAELVNLITAQRNFQANAKAIETSSTLTSTIINMRS
jgi:flagellar hook-basal body protein